ncbi:hypothetical protein [Streptomyces sp. NPDC002722]|uniref:hypothetical protein n=1 Tax=unclassified Streptomyces TaxID=2593676 RepID=UPI0033223A13
MSHVDNAASSSEGAWVFGLEEIAAADASEDGTMHQATPAFGRTLIRAPEDAPQALRWAAEEFVDQCGPDWAVSVEFACRVQFGEQDPVQPVDNPCLLPSVQAAPARLP